MAPLFTEGDNETSVTVKAVESLEDLNQRYADALVPLAAWFAVLAALGICGNIMVILIFTINPEYKNTNFKVFVISLAAIDLLTCVTLVPADIIKTRHYFYFENAEQCKVKCFFNLFGQISSALVLLLISVDRFRKVFSPMKHQIWPEVAARLVIAIIFVSLLLSLPGPFMCGITTENMTNIHGTNTTVHVCVVDEKFQNSRLRSVYKVGLVVLFCGVSIAYVIMYALVLKVVLRHRKHVGRGGSVQFESNPKFSISTKEERLEKCEIEKYNKEEDTPITCLNTSDEFRNSNSEVAQTSENDCTMTKQQHKSSPTFANKMTHDNQKRKYILKFSTRLSYQRKVVRRHSSSAVMCKIGGGIPYKTFIWIVLTLVYVLTYLVHGVLSFTRTLYTPSPHTLLLFEFFFRIYFVNNVVNPIVYIFLDKRFKASICRPLRLIKRFT